MDWPLAAVAPKAQVTLNQQAFARIEASACKSCEILS